MKTYVINIATVAKKEDAYDEVVTNLFPIIIRTYDESSLKEHLKKLSKQIKETLKSRYLYDHAWFYIRVLNGEDFKWKVSDVVEIDY